MPFVRATDRPLLIAVGDPIVASFLMEAGGLTLTGLTLYSDADENTFLGEVAGHAGSYNPLPDSGWLETGAIYSYGGGLVIVRQSHSRTEHAPEDAPALFSVYRAGGGVLEWVANESVQVGMHRLYLDVEYVALQAHTTQVDWSPLATLGVLWSVFQATEAWAVGVVYVGDNTAGAGNGDVVTYNGRRYRCIQSHTSIITWTPDVTPALWLDLGPI